LQTILQNLVNNALKYGDGADVLVGCRRRSGKISLEVHDKGPGIALEDQERIFAPFVRLSPLDLGHGEGLGLGLAIVKRMTTLLGLTLQVHSTPGKGTVMVVDGLEPCAQPSAEEAKQASYKDSLLVDLRVYLVGDNAELMDEFGALTQGWGCHATTVSCIERVCEDADFILLKASAVISGVVPEWSLLPAGATLAVVGDAGDSSSLPERAYKLTLPVKPLQLRSLLLTAASLKRALP
jgi:anti-sigma regulatory factor (Ser/Thr protein kinase)